MNGILLIDKPAGPTSAEVVRRVKRLLPRDIKIGHLGTLDPFATGLLPLCLGEGTKIAQFLNTADKGYEGIIQLGAATDTGDRTGTVVREAPVGTHDPVALAEICRRFTGEIRQRPPMYSALKRDGVPLYRLARRGIEVERTERSIRIDRLTLAMVGSDRLRLSVACSKGTYIRVLAEDVGAALGTEGHLLELRRTAFGDFTIDQAVALDDFDAAAPRGLVAMREAVRHLPAVVLDPLTATAVRRGVAGVLARLEGEGGEAVALVDGDGHLAAVAVREGTRWRYGRVFAPAFTSPTRHGTKNV